MEALPTIIAIDVSGSVANNANYFNKVTKIVDENPGATCMLWNDRVCTPGEKTNTNRADTKRWLQSKKGEGGTAPHVLAGQLPPKCSLILITDGEVGNSEVVRCTHALRGKEFEEVTCHYIGIEKHMNLGVSAAFTTKTKSKIIVNDTLYANVDTGVEIDLTKYETFDAFMQGYNELFALVKMRCLAGSRDVELGEKLKALQATLNKEIATRNTNDYELDASSYLSMVTTFQTIIEKEQTSDGDKIQLMIGQLLDAARGGKFSFDSLVPQRISAAKKVQEEEAVDDATYDGNFNCDITCEIDEPVMFLKEGNNVFDGLEKGYLEAIINNPFLIFNDKKYDPMEELQNKIRARICNPIGFAAAKQVFKTTRKDPFSNLPIVCFMAFNKDNDANVNYGLSTFFGNKLVGQPELWLCVFQQIVEDTLWIEDAFKERLKTYVIDRLKRCKTNISLSGLPGMAPIMKKVPVIHAITYCMLSPFFLKEPQFNRLRQMASSAHHYLRVMDLCGYDYPKELISRSIAIYRTFAWMNGVAKMDKEWYAPIRAQYQNWIEVGKTIVFLDGEVSVKYELPPYTKGLSLSDLVALAKLVDPSKKTNEVELNLDVEEPPPKAKTNYGYREDFNDKKRIKIDPATFRPFKEDQETKKNWKDAAELEYGCYLSKQISLYNYFGKYITEKGAYPVSEQLILYCWRGENNRGFDTLPKMIELFVIGLFKEYEEVFKSLPERPLPHEFAAKWSQEMNVYTKKEKKIN